MFYSAQESANYLCKSQNIQASNVEPKNEYLEEDFPLQMGNFEVPALNFSGSTDLLICACSLDLKSGRDHGQKRQESSMADVTTCDPGNERTAEDERTLAQMR